MLQPCVMTPSFLKFFSNHSNESVHNVFQQIKLFRSLAALFPVSLIRQKRPNPKAPAIKSILGELYDSLSLCPLLCGGGGGGGHSRKISHQRREAAGRLLPNQIHLVVQDLFFFGREGAVVTIDVFFSSEGRMEEPCSLVS